MEIKVNDFNISYNDKSKKYEIYCLDISNKTPIYKKYEVDYLGRVSQNIINDIKDLTILGYRLNPNLNKTIPEKK